MRALNGAERLRWRLARLWRSRRMRRALTLHIPLTLATLAALTLARDPRAHGWAAARYQEAREALAHEPRFAIAEIAVEGAGAALEADIAAALADLVGRSSLTAPAPALRARIEALPRVAAASVVLEPPAGLRVVVRERQPAALWRIDGALWEIDAEGVRLAQRASRAERPDLPVLAGAGAGDAAREALRLIAQAAPLARRLRGLTRVGARRWDMELRYGQRLMLPADAPEAALAQALAWHAERRIFDKDIEMIDLRLPDRPAFRLRARAMEAWRDRETRS